MEIQISSASEMEIKSTRTEKNIKNLEDNEIVKRIKLMTRDLRSQNKGESIIVNKQI